MDMLKEFLEEYRKLRVSCVESAANCMLYATSAEKIRIPLWYWSRIFTQYLPGVDKCYTCQYEKNGFEVVMLKNIIMQLLLPDIL